LNALWGGGNETISYHVDRMGGQLLTSYRTDWYPNHCRQRHSSRQASLAEALIGRYVLVVHLEQNNQSTIENGYGAIFSVRR